METEATQALVLQFYQAFDDRKIERALELLGLARQLIDLIISDCSLESQIGLL